MYHMNNSGLRSRVLAMLLLWLLPTFAHANEEALGPVKPEAVEFKPDRLFDPTVLLPIEVGGVWGYVDRRGNVVIAPQYDWVDYFYGPFTGAKSRGTWFARYMSQGRMGWLIFYENRKRGKGLIQGNDLRVIKAGNDT
jgi:WG containing repeat